MYNNYYNNNSNNNNNNNYYFVEEDIETRKYIKNRIKDYTKRKYNKYILADARDTMGDYNGLLQWAITMGNCTSDYNIYISYIVIWRKKKYYIK